MFHKSNSPTLTYRTVFVALNKTRFQSHLTTTSFYRGDMSQIITPPQPYLCEYVCMRERSSASEVQSFPGLAARCLGKALFPAFYQRANFVSPLCLSVSYGTVWVRGGGGSLTPRRQITSNQPAGLRALRRLLDTADYLVHCHLPIALERPPTDLVLPLLHGVFGRKKTASMTNPSSPTVSFYVGMYFIPNVGCSCICFTIF